MVTGVLKSIEASQPYSVHLQTEGSVTYADSPAVVRDEEGRMADPSDGVVDSLAGGESLVSACERRGKVSIRRSPVILACARRTHTRVQ